jgi:hypothetical protein
MKAFLAILALLTTHANAWAQTAAPPPPAAPQKADCPPPTEPPPREGGAPLDLSAFSEADLRECAVPEQETPQHCIEVEELCTSPENKSRPPCVFFRGAQAGAFRALTFADRVMEVPTDGPIPVAAAPDTLMKALEDCIKSRTCTSLETFMADESNANAVFELRTLCRERAGLSSRGSPSVRTVCAALIHPRSSPPAHVDKVTLSLFHHRMKKPAFDCGGFGFALPLVSLRRSGDEYEVTGPVSAGVGAGYYYAFACQRHWTWGPELFAFSEGLDPSKTLHVGVAGGLAITAFAHFNFGLALGYDLFRHRNLEDGTIRSTGLLTGRAVDKGDFTWLITFGIRSASQKTSNQDAVQPHPRD